MRQTTLRGSTSPESETSLSSWPAGRAPPLWEGCEQGTFRWRAQSRDGSQRQWPLRRTQGPRKQGTGLALSKEVTAKLQGSFCSFVRHAHCREIRKVLSCNYF